MLNRSIQFLLTVPLLLTALKAFGRESLGYTDIPRQYIEVVARWCDGESELVEISAHHQDITGASRLFYRPSPHGAYYQLQEHEGRLNHFFIYGRNGQEHVVRIGSRADKNKPLVVDGTKFIRFVEPVSESASFMRLPESYQDLVQAFVVEGTNIYVLLTTQRFSRRTHDDTNVIVGVRGRMNSAKLAGVFGLGRGVWEYYSQPVEVPTWSNRDRIETIRLRVSGSAGRLGHLRIYRNLDDSYGRQLLPVDLTRADLKNLGVDVAPFEPFTQYQAPVSCQALLKVSPAQAAR